MRMAVGTEHMRRMLKDQSGVIVHKPVQHYAEKVAQGWRKQ